MMMRLFLLFATFLALLLQEQQNVQAVEGQDALCATLEAQVDELVATDAGAVCECKEGDDKNSLEYTCTVDTVCLTSGVGENKTAPYSGRMSSIVILDGLDGTTYSRQTLVRLCFDYDDNGNLYGGANVCHETIPEDSLGGLGVCSIQVDGALCEMCEFCPGRDENYLLRSVFDCSNVGGEEARVCTSDYSNNTDTILRFLANPQRSTECEGFGDSSAAANQHGLLLSSTTVLWISIINMAMVLPFVFV